MGKLFGTDGVRGVANTELTGRLAYELGRAGAYVLTKETYHMFDQELFDGMREDSILVNVARGALIEENALKQALDTGKFRAVILDVFEKEPLNENFWGWKAERVRIIPHNTFESKKNKERLKKQILDNLRDWADKIPIEHGKKYDL